MSPVTIVRSSRVVASTDVTEAGTFAEDRPVPKDPALFAIVPDIAAIWGIAFELALAGDVPEAAVAAVLSRAGAAAGATAAPAASTGTAAPEDDDPVVAGANVQMGLAFEAQPETAAASPMQAAVRMIGRMGRIGDAPVALSASMPYPKHGRDR
jgi:hypothetical protein